MFQTSHILTLLHKAALLIAALCAFSCTALACQICIPYPKKSAADHLIESDAVVFAREDPDRPFHFSAIETLKGDPGNQPIDLFLDSSTRRILAIHPERSIVLGQSHLEGEPTWRRIGLINKDTELLVRNILKKATHWVEHPEQRPAFFAHLIGHEAPQVSTLAHLELARAPYSEIRRHGDALSRDQIHAFLNNIRYAEWHPLYILLLAQSDNSDDHIQIRDAIENAANYQSKLNLSAWATALIEIDQNGGIQTLTHHYLSQSSRSREELEAILTALSVQGGSNSGDLQDLILPAYQVALETHPDLAPLVVQDLVQWRRDDLASSVAKIASTRPPLFDLTTTLKLRNYARMTFAPAEK